jgi:flavin-dependent dehydrogenase
MYDAIVVGARCAGSPTAMLLARKGYRVLLVDRAAFPSDTMSTHLIWQPGVAQLKRWGLLEKLRASNCPPISKVTFDFGALALTGSPPPTDGACDAYCPRRMVLDKILVEAAVEAGAELRESFSVRELVMDGDRVTGIRGRVRGGSTVTEKGRIVIGADGRHSLVARTGQAPIYREVPALAFYYYSYWGGVPTDGFSFYSRDYRAIFVLPTNYDLTLISVAWPKNEFRHYRADIEGNFLKTLELAPALAECVRDGRRKERFVGTGDLANFFRRPYGPGWALVGDAGYCKDPITAQGITDAFRDAGTLAQAIDDGFSGRRPLEEALAHHERQRNQAVMPLYEFACRTATLEPTRPRTMELIAALRGNQEQTDRLLGLTAGTTAIAEFFSPENIQLIVGSH